MHIKRTVPIFAVQKKSLAKRCTWMPLVLNSSDVSALPKLAIKSVHGCTLLMRQRSNYPPICELCRPLITFPLQPIHLPINAAFVHQLGVGAGFGDCALVEHDNLVGVFDGAEAVRDNDNGFVFD